MQNSNGIPRKLIRFGMAAAVIFAASAAPVAAVTLTSEHYAEINARTERARALVERIKPEAVTQHFSAGWDIALMSQLLNRSSDELDTLMSLKTYSEISAAANAIGRSSRVNTKSHGFGTVDLIFHTISPCRLLDTRNAVGPLAANTTRTASMNSSSAQGGLASCTSTIRNADAVIGDNSAWGALALNATVANTGAGPAFLRLRPVGSTNSTSFLNWTTLNSQIANAGIVALDNSGAFEMLASSATDVIIDVFGVFGITDDTNKCTSVFNATNTVVPVGSFTSLTDANIAACPTGYKTISYVYKYVTGTGSISQWFNDPEGDGIGFAHAPYNSGGGFSNMTITVGRRCCRIP